MDILSDEHFRNDDAARAYLEGLRWPDGPICAHCGAINHAYAIKPVGTYRCAEPECRKNFTVTMNTPMERSHIALHKWLQAFHLMVSSKKGISAHQLHRTLAITYRSAWFMAHRVRECMRTGGLGGPKRREAFELHLLQEHLVAIGHIALRAAMLDNLVSLTIKQIIVSYPSTVKTELEKMSATKRLDLIKEALIADMPESKNAISEFISEIWATRAERNDIMHKTWRSTDTPEIKALIEIMHPAPDKILRKVTAQTMLTLAERTLDLALELGDWKMCANDAVSARSAASPGRPPPPILRRPHPRTSAKDQKMPRG